MTRMRLQVQEKAVTEGVVLALAGEIDFSTLGVLDDALVRCADAPVVVADLAAVTFIDSVGLTTLLRVHRDLAARGGRLAVVGAKGSVRFVLEMAGIDQVIAQYPTIRAALDA